MLDEKTARIYGYCVDYLSTHEGESIKDLPPNIVSVLAKPQTLTDINSIIQSINNCVKTLDQHIDDVTYENILKKEQSRKTADPKNVDQMLREIDAYVEPKKDEKRAVAEDRPKSAKSELERAFAEANAKAKPNTRSNTFRA